MFKVHNDCWIIFLMSNMQFNIPMSSSTCSTQGLPYKLRTCEFYCFWNGYTACWLLLACWKFRKMLTVNIPHVLVFYEHAMLFLLELLFQGYQQYAQFRGSLISFVHASFVEQKLVFWSNMQVFGSTCGSHGSNQYQILGCFLSFSDVF